MAKGTLVELTEMYGRYLDTSTIHHKKLDIVYGEASQRNKLDIYYPDDFEERKLYPAIVFFHGGGFFKGDKGRYQLLGALQGVYHGYAVISVNYRLTIHEAYPAYMKDAFAALRFLKANGKQLNVDYNHIALWGESAGSWLAVLAGIATEPDTIFDDYTINDYHEKLKPTVIIDWFGPSGESKSLEECHNNTFQISEIKMPTLSDEELEAYCKAEGIKQYLNPNSPAVLIQHGTADQFVPLDNSLHLKEILLKELSPDKVELDIMSGYHHGVEEFTTRDNIEHIFTFIDKHI